MKDPGLLINFALDSAVAEAYRGIRTNLAHATRAGGNTSIAITSDGPEQGKTLTCANLGIVMSRADQRVLLIDCDLRRPALHRAFDVPAGDYPRALETATNATNWRACVDEHAVQVLDDLWLLPGGAAVDHPSELLGSVHFAGLLAAAVEQFDHVILDTPPIGVVTDAAVIAAQADCTLLVVDARRSRRRDARRALRRLQDAGVTVAGTIINRAPARHDARTAVYATSAR